MDDIILDKIHYLIDYLNKCSTAYDQGNPIISDREWDNKYFELKQLEEESGLIFPNSPTQTIFYEVVNALEKIEHSHKMLSLDKTKDLNEVNTFVGKQSYLAMCKMDGLTCSLTYENGELVSAETRGNGIIGENILHNAKVIPSIPTQIPIKEKIIVDGEIICSYHDFEAFASDYKNPRNFASGSIRLLDSKECSKRKLSFIAWDVIEGFENEDELQWKLSALDDCGFSVVPYIYLRNTPIGNNDANLTIINDVVNSLVKIATDYGYPIDGIVFKFNDIAYGKSLGETSHHFKNAIAYKFYDEVYATELLDIEWSMGRTGVLTPVAIFNPIEIDGSIVVRASLHNISVMEELSGGFERVGDTLYVYKANQIIPQIDSWEHNNEYSSNNHLKIPKDCPICGYPTEIRIDNDSKMLYCVNPNCEGKLINRLDHFCGKKGLDIKGLSKATLEKLIEWGWISDYVSLFELSKYKDEWIKKAGFGLKSVEKILDAIESSRQCDLHQFIAALGIPLIGAAAAKDLAKKFKTWDAFIEAVDNKYEFYQLDGFGWEMYQSIVYFDCYTEAKYLIDNFITIKSVTESKSQNTSLEGIVFVITGKLNYFKNRDEIKNKIESLGGKVTSAVSKNTNYLINNDKNSTSSKNKTAQSLGIPILSEEDFIQTFNIQ